MYRYVMIGAKIIYTGHEQKPNFRKNLDFKLGTGTVSTGIF